MATKKYISLSRLSTFLDNLKDTFASLGHTHTVSEIKDYKVDTELSASSSNPVANKVLDAEFEAVSEAMAALELSIDGKANATHSHAISDVTNLQSNLDAKVPTSRTINGKALTANITLSASDVGADASGSASAVQTNLDTHAANTSLHFTTTEKTKLSGIETGAQKNTITGVKGNSESSYRTGNVNITKANIGLGNVDNTSDANKPVSTAQKTAIDSALASAKSYTDTSLASYYTKTQIDSYELITTDDIDTICGSSVVAASEVTF